MLSIESIDSMIKSNMKEQRLMNLQAQWFEYTMNKIAFEANGLTKLAEEAGKKLNEIQTAYDAIAALDIGSPAPPTESE